MYKRFYGEKNYKKVLKESPIEEEKLRDGFLEEYPSADVGRFKFNVAFNQNGSVGEKSIFFQDPDEEISSFDITSSTFKNNPDWTQYLYWPRGWGENGKVEELKNLKNKKKTFEIDLNKLLIFVTEKKKFVVDLNRIDIGRSDSSSFDYINNTHSTAIASAYVTTYLCGISEQQLTNKVKRASSNIVTSIAQYHFVYHLRRFLRQPEKLKKYMTKDVVKLITTQQLPNKEKWITRYSNSSASLDIFRRELEKKGITDIKNLRLVANGNQGATTEYEEYVSGRADKSTDYMLFIPKNSTGLTKLGQKLFQQSLESYIYCVLGAQARTRWSIVDQGAKSSQTQEVFVKLMNDTIAQDDITVSISNMRKAIKNTNVVLNFAISPGLILIPSDMRILINPLSGFNNFLTLATNKMSFGGNKNINKFAVKPQIEYSVKPQIEYPNSFKPRVNIENYNQQESEAVLPVVFGASIAGIFFIFKKFFLNIL